MLKFYTILIISTHTNFNFRKTHNADFICMLFPLLRGLEVCDDLHNIIREVV